MWLYIAGTVSGAFITFCVMSWIIVNDDREE
jgi:hypothetical protein